MIKTNDFPGAIIKKDKLIPIVNAATDHLKELLDKKKEIQTEELMAAVGKSKRSYEEILRHINSEDGAEL